MTVMETLMTRLAEKEFNPLVDQDAIPPGQEWKPHIVDWLARCRAAVVLINKKALTSDWVRREVNILMWRRALGARLTVVPVLLGDLPTGVVKDAGMAELGIVQFARTARGAPQDAQSIAELVLAQFADLPKAPPGGDPMNRWLGRLELFLSEAQRSALLVRAAEALELEEKYVAHVTGQQGGCLFLAHQFLVAPPDRMEDALDELAPALSHHTLRQLTGALKATWVNEEAARKLLPAPNKPPQEMTALLNASRPGTAEQYIRRATCNATRGYEVKSVGAPIGEDRAGERLRDWEREVWLQFFDAPEEEDQVLPSDLLERTHYLIIDESRPPDAEFAAAVQRLHRNFSWLIILVATGKDLPPPEVQAAFHKPILLEPVLAADNELVASLRSVRLDKMPDRHAGKY